MTSDSSFTLHKQLEADCEFIIDLALCRVLLLNDSNYPWALLVPRVSDATEVFLLPHADQIQITKESAMLGNAMNNLFKPDKMNIAALGNMVPQLHIHHIARYKNDAAWPAPIWGVAHSLPYTDESRQLRIDSIRKELTAPATH